MEGVSEKKKRNFKATPEAFMLFYTYYLLPGTDVCATSGVKLNLNLAFPGTISLTFVELTVLAAALSADDRIHSTHCSTHIL